MDGQPRLSLCFDEAWHSMAWHGIACIFEPFVLFELGESSWEFVFFASWHLNRW